MFGRIVLSTNIIGTKFEKRQLTIVTIPDNVKSISSATFNACEELKSVVIGASVTFIGSFAFERCYNLTSVYYKGTAEDWGKISNGEGNSDLFNVTQYYYSENKPTTVGKYWHYVDGVPTKW